MAELEQSHDDSISVTKLNWLRAAVLGANDGIVSVAAIVLGVAAATNSRGAIFTAGLAGLVAGALSMAVGEYVSVSSQRDSEKAYIEKEKEHLEKYPKEELDDLTITYIKKGLSTPTARKVAVELTEKDAIKAHLDAEFGLDEDELNNPWQAGVASLLAFTVGGVVPLFAILAVAAEQRFMATFVAVVIILAITGYVSATIGKAHRVRAVIRVTAGGAAAMAITYGIGSIFGTAIG